MDAIPWFVWLSLGIGVGVAALYFGVRAYAVRLMEKWF